MAHPSDDRQAHKSHTGRLILAWSVIGIPLAYGVSQTLIRATQLFTG